MKKTVLLCFAAMLTMVSCQKKAETKDNIQSVKVDTVQYYGNMGSVQIPGRVKAAEDVNIAFRVAGTISKFHVAEGSPVHKGQLLVELDSRDYQTQLKATEAEYKQVKAEAERVMALYKENSTTENNYDKAQYGLQQITAKYENHKNQLADTKLYAPFDGYVQQLLFDSHETVDAGMPVISMINSSLPEVEINIPASTYIQRDKMEQFSCTFDVYPGISFPLTLLSINQKANANQLYTMRLKLSSVEGKTPTPGMATMVTILSKEDHKEVTVKETGVFAENGKSYVYVLNKNTVEKRPVTVGRLLQSGRMTITSGLQAGDVIVSSGVHSLQDKQQVKPLSGTSASNVGGLL